MITAQCFNCRHLREEPPSDGWGFACAAFPKGIPEEALTGNRDHREPVDGDHGVRFEPVGVDLDPDQNDGDGGLLEQSPGAFGRGFYEGLGDG